MGNTDPETFVSYWFVEMHRAQYLRIIPDLYDGHTCLRFELFGCDGGKLKACHCSAN